MMIARILVACLVGVLSVSAQEVSAGLTGRVTDSTGSPVANASVIVRDQDRGVAWNSSTNEDGVYAYPRIPNGTYGLRIEAPGFKTFSRSGIALELNQRGRIDVVLELGAVSETVEVRGDVPLLQTEMTQVGATVTATTMDEAPLISRNVLELTLIIPGVTTTDPSTFTTGARAESGSGGRPFVNGNREQANNFLLDGIDNNQLSDNLSPYQPNPDSLQEMKVITNNASAEFGNYQGGVVNMVIKSGTNRFQGNVFHTFRNDVLNANSWSRNWSGVNRLAMRWNQFGGTYGGRLVRDKLFFFVDYQALRRASPTSLVTASVFPVAWRNGDFSSLLTANGRTVQLYNPFSVSETGRRDPFPRNQIPVSMYDPVARKLFADTRVFPKQTVDSLTDNLRYATRSQVNSDQGDVKIDWKPWQRDYFTFRFSQGSQDSDALNSYLLAFPAYRRAPVHLGVANWTRTVSPSLVNEFRVGVNHNLVEAGTTNNGLGDYAQELGIKNAGTGLLALRGFAYVSTLGGINNGIASLFNTNTLHIINNTTLVVGRHMVKTGAQMLQQRMETYYSGNNGNTGYMAFSGRFTALNAVNPAGTLVGEADFVLGLPSDLGKGIASGTWHHSSTVYGAYVQDDWRVSDSLTLNLGVRWEYHSPWVEADDNQSNFDLYSGQLRLAGKDGNSRGLYEPFLKDFQPRVGFAWTPKILGKSTVLRGAYTISSYLEGTGTNLRLPLNPPFNSEFQALYNTPDYWLPPSRLQDGLAGINPKDPFVGATLRVWDPFVRPANSQQWSLAFERQLPFRNVLTASYVGQHNTHLMVPMPYLQKQIVNGVVVPGPYLSGNPTLLKQITQVSGTASDGNAMYHALQTYVRKRFSNGIDYQVGYTWSKAMTDAQGYYGTTGQAAGAGNYIQNLYDRRAEWGPTFFDTTHNMTGSASYSLPFGRRKKYASHMPGYLDAMFGGWQMASIYTLRTGFPLTPRITGDPSATGSRGMRANVVGTPNDPHLVGPNQPYLDVKAYSVPTARTFGTSGIGVVRGPGMTRLDLSLNKSFRLGERRQFQLRAAAYNLTNTPILQAPSSMIITAPTFGQIRASQGERNIQLVAKIYF